MLKHILSLALLIASSSAQAPQVTLDYGTFVGSKDNNTGTIAYRGVRYAEAPVGNLRFRAAVSPPSKDLGVVDATQFGDTCIQNSQVAEGSSEDCLFGNIYIPASAVSESLPVLVWFHGGGFISGSSRDADPTQLFATTKEPFVFVSFQYRLGPFGFLGGSSVKADGQLNAGLQDQRTAMRWVQRYIGKFGGDPSKVTIWGQSAGAGSTMFHLLANNGDSEGLFRAAMGDSPSLSFTPPSDGDYIQSVFDDIVSNSGCDDAYDAATLDCLRTVDTATIASAGQGVLAARPAILYVFAPQLDGKFITTRPVEGFTEGKFAQVPILFGANSNEGANWSNRLTDPNANTSMPNATENTVYNFLKGQYATFTRDSFENARALYPLEDYNNSFSLQGQQMYGETRYICTASLMTGGAASKSPMKAFQYQ
ncbi:hypothetical protein AAF712_006533 [Marasmius tenuissimus]|uniref:Carboxylic ester hydrolase n=1 Tax=Marasmius tenuissimus TaxID=585030 RepID=A0ABR2ZYS2_9AGAR